MSTNIKVILRVRPKLPREDSTCLVHMPPDEPGKTYLDHPNGRKSYLFDEAIWSYNPQDPSYHDNVAFYKKCCLNLLEHLYQGYNVCLLAYGQTGSGKTHTMIGEQKSPGIIPLVVRDILSQKEALVEKKINCEVSFSYIEIYNEKVKDLLADSKICRIREDPSSGPYVEGSTTICVKTFEEFLSHLQTGNAARMTASTRMNDSSSRSHAVLTFTLRQTKFLSNDSEDSIGVPVEELVSNIKLVDLAGSERLARTQAFQTDRLKEGMQINKSLTALGRCFGILSSGGNAVVPYRDSTLTYLLRENLAGNSRTSMIFCVSPVDLSETHQTLNYAMKAKRVKTKAKVGSCKLLTNSTDWNFPQSKDKTVIESLRGEIDLLNKQLAQFRSEERNDDMASLVKYLSHESERQAFEIKYLKNQLQCKDEEFRELKNQNGYLNTEIKTVLKSHFSREKQLLLKSAEELVGFCGREAQMVSDLIKELSIEKIGHRVKDNITQ